MCAIFQQILYVVRNVLYPSEIYYVIVMYIANRDSSEIPAMFVMSVKLNLGGGEEYIII